MKNFKIKLRLWLLEFLDPVQRLISWWALPETRAEGHWVEVAQAVLEPGDILLSYNQLHLSNIFIPGFYNHAAIYTGSGLLVEAEPDPGVKTTNLIEWIMKKDAICAVRPKFVSWQGRLDAAKNALTFVGSGYDRGFEVGGKTFFCSEVTHRAYEPTKWSETFTRRDFFGVLTVTPQDYRNCVTDQKAELLFEFGITPKNA